MKNVKTILISTALLALAAPVALANSSRPYIGAEAIQTNQGYKTLFGKKVFKQNPQNYGIFMGFNFTRNFGMELGYDMQPKRNKDTTLVAGDVLSGQSSPSGSNNVTTESSIRSSNPYLGLFAEYKVRRTKFGALLAASVSHVKARSAILATNGTTSSASAYGASVRNYAKTKVVPMVKLSATHYVTRCIGVRFSLNYRNMQSFKMLAEQSPNSQLKMRDAFGIGLGVTYSFY